MLTKAYIQEVISPHSIRVRIPLYNKIANVEGATPNNELGVACVCTLPNFITAAQEGDIVIVGFEEDIISKPVVLGHLSTATEKETLTDITCNQLNVMGDTTLSEYTNIGDITPDNIKCLKDLKANVNDTFIETTKSLDNINIKLLGLEESTISNASSITNIVNTDLSSIYSSIATLSSRVDTLETNCKDLLKKFDDYLMKYPTILGVDASGRKSYGNSPSEISSPKEGQIYFTLKPGDSN